MSEYQGRLAVQQRVLPNYRVPFFDALARRCRGGLALFAGEPLPGESIPTGRMPQAAAYARAKNVHRFRPGHPLYSCRQPGLVRWLEDTQPDVLVVEANPRYLSSFGAIRWMHARRRPVLGWGLGAPEETGAGAWLRRLARSRLLHRLDGIIAYSTLGAEEYARTGQIPPERIFVARNAVAPPPAHPAAAPGSRPGALRLLFVGRLQQRKRLDELLYACAALPDHLQPGLAVIGDGPERDALERVAAAVYPETRFTGHLTGDALAAEFRSADLFVLPGTGGLAVQEAMSWGLPVIVAEGDGTQADLVRPENGWQVPPGDPAALRAALADALSDPEALARKGAESRRIAVEEINIERMADHFAAAVRFVTEAS